MILLLAISRRQFVKVVTAVGASIFGMLRIAAAEPRAAAASKATLAAQTPMKPYANCWRAMSGSPVGGRIVRGGSPADFRQLAEGQYPFAMIIGCADSRVAPEILFDVGKGDIFVVRVAGNVVSGAGAVVKGSIEYAVAELNVPLIMVLGHSNCGAVKAAMAHLNAKDSLPGAINDLVELIKPAVEQSKGESADPLNGAIHKNVQIGVERLKGLEPILATQVKEGKLKIVGGVYDLRTGKVTLVK